MIEVAYALMRLGPLQKIAPMKVTDLEMVSQFSWYVQRILKSLVLVQSMCGDTRYGFVAVLVAEPMNASFGSMAVAANGVAADPNLVVFVVEGVMVVAGITLPSQRCKRHLPTVIRENHASGIFVVDVVKSESGIRGSCHM